MLSDRIFQSTRPLRGGTAPPLGHPVEYVISIHPPLAGRDYVCKYISKGLGISIHPPLAGRDRNKTLILLLFCISIHPPLAGRDRAAFPPRHGLPFQSTRPLRGGTSTHGRSARVLQFQSTRPLRGGTTPPH